MASIFVYATDEFPPGMSPALVMNSAVDAYTAEVCDGSQATAGASTITGLPSCAWRYV
jgi:hypothetical protein